MRGEALAPVSAPHSTPGTPAASAPYHDSAVSLPASALRSQHSEDRGCVTQLCSLVHFLAPNIWVL